LGPLKNEKNPKIIRVQKPPLGPLENGKIPKNN
jgi:hypothetical protein